MQNLYLESSIQKHNKEPKTKPFIIAVGGGKGGVGKSFFSSNLALALSRTHKVCIVDLDLGASNIHTCLGVHLSQSTLSDYIFNNKSFSEIKQDTPFNNLKVITGAHDHLEITNSDLNTLTHLFNGIESLSEDIVILDLGAGSNLCATHFFTQADLSLALTSPDPTSIENAYRFLKACFYKKIRQLESKYEIQSTIDNLMSHRDSFQIKSPANLLQSILHENPLKGKQLINEMQSLNIGLILNQIRMKQEDRIGLSISRVCKDYFGVPCHYYGSLSYDDSVWQSVRKKQPLLHAYPYSRLSTQILEIAKNLVGSPSKSAVI